MVKNISSKIRNKTKISILASLPWHCFWRSSHKSQIRKKGIQIGKARSKTICRSVCVCVFMYVLSYSVMSKTPFDPRDCSPSGSSLHGIFPPGILGLLFPLPKDLLDPRIEAASPESSALAGRFFWTLPPRNSFCRW